MAVRFYDIRSDETRDVTQQDVDEMQAVVSAYGRLRQAVAQVHEELRAALDEVKQRHQLNPTIHNAMDTEVTQNAEDQDGGAPA